MNPWQYLIRDVSELSLFTVSWMSHVLPPSELLCLTHEKRNPQNLSRNWILCNGEIKPPSRHLHTTTRTTLTARCSVRGPLAPLQQSARTLLSQFLIMCSWRTRRFRHKSNTRFLAPFSKYTKPRTRYIFLVRVKNLRNTDDKLSLPLIFLRAVATPARETQNSCPFSAVHPPA